METPADLPDDLGADHRGDASGHVDNARAGEVDHAAHDAVGVPRAEEARGVPHPVHDHGVDEADEYDAVGQVGACVRMRVMGSGGAEGRSSSRWERAHPGGSGAGGGEDGVV